MVVLAVKRGEQYVFDLSNYPALARFIIRKELKHGLDVLFEKSESKESELVIYDYDKILNYALFKYGEFLAIADKSERYMVLLAFKELTKEFTESVLINLNREKDEFHKRIEEIQQNTKEVVEISTKNIDVLLQRGEKLEDLLPKIEHLHAQSVSFRRSAADLNRCCLIL